MKIKRGYHSSDNSWSLVLDDDAGCVASLDRAAAHALMEAMGISDYSIPDHRTKEEDGEVIPIYYQPHELNYECVVYLHIETLLEVHGRLFALNPWCFEDRT